MELKDRWRKAVKERSERDDGFYGKNGKGYKRGGEDEVTVWNVFATTNRSLNQNPGGDGDL